MWIFRWQLQILLGCRPRFCTIKAILGRRKPGRMRWILLWIMPQAPDRSLDLLANSPARHHCTMDASTHKILVTQTNGKHNKRLMEIWMRTLLWQSRYEFVADGGYFASVSTCKKATKDNYLVKRMMNYIPSERNNSSQWNMYVLVCAFERSRDRQRKIDR